MAKEINDDKAPSFFKFFQGGPDHINLKIPIAFTQCINEPLPEEVLLKDRNDNVFKVKVAKIDDSWFFTDGWENFVSDNSVTYNDLLVFHYSTKDLFHVKLFGTCGTEKNIIGTSRMTGDDDDNNDDDQHMETSMDDVDDDNDDDEEEAGIGGDNEQANLPPQHNAIGIWELVERLRGPFFVKSINPKRPCHCFIPAYIIKGYNLNIGREITLVDPRGREYPSECLEWADGRRIIAGGWKMLCRENNVSLNDLCICEFVEREGDHRQFFIISFIRANI